MPPSPPRSRHSHRTATNGDRRRAADLSPPAVVILGGLVMPFSTVLVPEVGRGRERPAFATIAAMRRAVRGLAALDADLLLLIVPSAVGATPAPPILVYAAAELRAGFDAFGEYGLAITASGAPAAAEAIARAGIALQTPAQELTAEAATVVYFLRPLLAQATVLMLQVDEATTVAARADLRERGARLADLPLLSTCRVAIAVGAELSQRIFPGAPAGYHPDGARFDEAVQRALAASDLAALEQIPADLSAAAAERALNGLSLLGGLLGSAGGQFHLLSYEAPFGAGFAVASFTPGISG